MSKFRIKFKLTGLEIEIEGNRTDVPMIAENVGQQISGLLSPTTRIIEGEATDKEERFQPAAIDVTPTQQKKARKRRTSSAATTTIEADAAGPVDWRHDTSKWGAPQQSWSSANKAIWLLYVVAKEASVSELSASRIASTFNKHFRQSGLIRPNNLSRDLGKLKSEREPVVSEDTTKRPSNWFLTNAGIRRGEGLVAEALGKPEQVSAAGTASS